MKITGIFKETSGQWSAVRIAFVAWSIGAFMLYANVALQSGSMPPIPVELTAIISLLGAGKVIQKPFERSLFQEESDDSKEPSSEN